VSQPKKGSDEPPHALKIALISAGAAIIAALIATLGHQVVIINNEPTPTPTPIIQTTPTPRPPSKTPTFMPSPTPSPIVSSQPSDSYSSLIPPGQQPVVNDPLNNNSQGYGWDEGQAGGGSCNFVPEQHYVLSAPANGNSVGCNTENPKGSFSNFVYQIKMTIRQGIDDGITGEAGPTFRVHDNAPGYQVSFDVNGNWSVTYNSTMLSQATTPFPYFHSGVNQSNYITIRADGSSIQVQVNGHDLGSFTNSSDAAGFIGVEMTPGSDMGNVSFSDVRVWQL
jgi:hypothetical protein